MALPRANYAESVFEVYNRLRANHSFNQNDIGAQMRDLYPEYFKGMKPHSICKAINTQAQERDIEVVQGSVGGKPRRIPENDSRWRDRNPELVLPFNPKVQVGSDIHFPLHSTEWCERFIQVARAREIEVVVLNGDLFDNGHKGHGGDRDIHSPSWDDGCDSIGYWLRELIEVPSLKQIVSVCGNHDDKVFRKTDQEMQFRDYWSKATQHLPGWTPLPLDPLQPGKLGDDIDVFVTNRYYATMEPQEPAPWPFAGPRNFPWRFTHQKEYSRIPGRADTRLATVEPANTVAGHHHHLSIVMHESDLYYGVGAGTGQAPDLAPYKNARQSTHPKWASGFVTIEWGTPMMWRMDSDEAWWVSMGIA